MKRGLWIRIKGGRSRRESRRRVRAAMKRYARREVAEMGRA